MYKWLERLPASGPYTLKAPGPKTIDEWFEAMDDALIWAAAGQASGAPAFDHGRMLFDRISLSVQRELNRETAQAHADLRTATSALKIATWVLAAITVALGIVEGVKLFGHS